MPFGSEHPIVNGIEETAFGFNYNGSNVLVSFTPFICAQLLFIKWGVSVLICITLTGRC